MLEAAKPVTRQELINREWVIDLPVIRKPHNRYRKDTLLSPEQKESLKENYGNLYLKGMTEQDILKVLRKRHKNHKLTMFAIIRN
jgi:hypothetical protein